MAIVALVAERPQLGRSLIWGLGGGETGMADSLSGRHSVGANGPDRATKSQGNLFFYGGHNGGQDIVRKSLSPLYVILYITLQYSPQGSLW